MLSLLFALASAQAAPCDASLPPGRLKTCVLQELADQEAADLAHEAADADLQALVVAQSQRIDDLEARLAAFDAFLVPDVANDRLTVDAGTVAILVGSDLDLQVGGDLRIDAGGSLALTSQQAASLQAAQVTVDASGPVSIAANDMSVTASGALDLAAGLDLSVQSGSVVTVGGADVDVSAVQQVDVAGRFVAVRATDGFDLLASRTASLAAGTQLAMAAGQQITLDAPQASLTSDLFSPVFGAISDLLDRIVALENRP